MKMIRSDSVLARIPESMDRADALFIDGLRHAAQMATASYMRLHAGLTDLSRSNSVADGVSFSTHAFIDAWSIVDSIDRYKALWKSCPLIIDDESKKRFDLESKFQPIREIRNIPDHLAPRIPEIVKYKGSALGTLSWTHVSSLDPLAVELCSIIPGTLARDYSEHTMPELDDCKELGACSIGLRAGKYRVSLSNAIVELTESVVFLESLYTRYLEQEGRKDQPATRDIYAKLYVQKNKGEDQFKPVSVVLEHLI